MNISAEMGLFPSKDEWLNVVAFSTAKQGTLNNAPSQDYSDLCRKEAWKPFYKPKLLLLKLWYILLKFSTQRSTLVYKYTMTISKSQWQLLLLWPWNDSLKHISSDEHLLGTISGNQILMSKRAIFYYLNTCNVSTKVLMTVNDPDDLCKRVSLQVGIYFHQT